MGLAWQRTLEEHYHQAFEHQLFFGRGGPERLAEALSVLPALMRPLLSYVLRRQLREQLYARGLGRHTEAQIIAMGQADLDALDAHLQGRTFVVGDRPSTADATVFGFLGVTIYVAGDNPLFRHAASLPNLVRYTDTLRSRFFPETVTQKVEAR
jgi:glutathione S-transferase